MIGDPDLEFFFKLYEGLIMKDKKLTFEQKEDFYINLIF